MLMFSRARYRTGGGKRNVYEYKWTFPTVYKDFPFFLQFYTWLQIISDRVKVQE